MLEELGDDVAVIFVESQGATDDYAEAFAYERGWMQSTAMWTTERPASTGLGTLPSFILLDVEGRVLMKGNTNSMKGRIEDAIEDQLKLVKKLPEDMPKALGKAWKALAERDFAKAVTELDKAADKAKDEAAVAALRARIDERIESEHVRLAYLVDEGLFVEALEAVDVLGERVEGLEEHTARVHEVAQRLESEELAPEVSAAEAFEKLAEKVREDGIEDNRKKLVKFAEKHPGTKAAERARRLAKLET